MERNKFSAMAIIAVILGAVGLGVGAYSIISVQMGAVKGEDGDDGDDGVAGITTIVYKTENEYPCSSEAEINNALAEIGTGNGKIIITGPITLTSHIDIDGGGTYIIQGTGLPTIDCGGDRTVFIISNAKSCIIEDLIIDASDVIQYNTTIIKVNETNNNMVHIENVQIIGDSDNDGYGVYIRSDNVWVEDCYFNQIRTGVIMVEVNDIHIFGNTIDNCGSGIKYGSIKEGNRRANVTIEGNIIKDLGYGIGIDCANASHYTINNNIFLGSRIGIILHNTNYTIVTGNLIRGITVSAGGNISGILIMDSSYNSICNNGIYDHKFTGGGFYGHGILIYEWLAISLENTVIGNTALNNDIAFGNTGTNTFGNATLNNFG